MVREVLCALALTTSAVGQPCVPTWSSEFAAGDFDGAVRASVVYNDGTGAALYVGGTFSRAGGAPAGGVAKWTGADWVPVGDPFDGEIYALHVHTDGALYAAGRFAHVGDLLTPQVAKWNGTAWVRVGSQVLSGTVRAMASAPDPGGQSQLWIGGQFLFIPGVGNGFAARWNGASWSFPGNSGGTSMEVCALAVFSEGGQTRLFAGGVDRGFPLTSSVRRWTGSGWEPVGNPGVIGRVNSLGTFFDGAGEALVAAGEVTAAGGQSANRIARWNGQAWSAMGGGLDAPINALALFDPDAQGPLPSQVMAAGLPMNSLGETVSPIWYWNGTSWMARATGMNDSVYTLRPFGASSLFTGGSFSSTGVVTASRAAYLNGAGFHAMANSMVGNSPSETVRCFAWFDDDGPGPHAAKLYVGGHFQRIGTISARFLAAWDGSTWSALNSQINGPVHALKVHDDGTGPALYAGGAFTMIDGLPASRIARWNGQEWSAVGQGFNGQVLELETFAPSGGPDHLYACGYFSAPGGGQLNGVARWNGTAWAPLSSGSQTLSIIALKAFNGPFGPRLYMADGDNISPSVFEWNGTTLLTASTGLGAGSYIEALEVYDDGSGPALYAGGSSLSPNASALDSVARFNGTTWSIVPGGPSYQVLSLAVHDDGRGPALYAGGNFRALVTGVASGGLVRWDGQSWADIAGNMVPTMTGMVLSMLSVDRDGPGPEEAALYVGGSFNALGGVSAGNIARLDGCGCYANCDSSTASPLLSANDFICFIGAYSAALPYANCDRSPGGELTANDFICFMNAYTAGCP